MKCSVLLLLLLTWRETSAIRVNITEPELNKTKRGLIHQTHVYGETSFKPIAIYTDNNAATTQPGLINYYAPKYVPNVKQVYEYTTAPKVTAQQVLYEYQQTPHNSVSNVHVNQQFQTTTQQNSDIRPESTQKVVYTNYPNQPQRQLNPTTAETVVTPVQHSSYIQHVPYVQHEIQQQVNPYLIGKHIYANGKYVYYPHAVSNPYYPHQLEPENQQQHIQNPNLPQHHQVQQHSQLPQHHQVPQHSQLPQHHQFSQHPQHLQNHRQQLNILSRPPPQKMTPPGLTAPMTFQHQNNIKKDVTPKEEQQIVEDEKEERSNQRNKEEQEVDEEEEDEEKGEVQNEDDEDERSDNRNEEDEDEQPFDRYSYDDDEEEEEGRSKYRHDPEAEEEESEDDSNNEQTSYRKPRNYRKTEKKPKYKKSMSTNYKVKEGYESNTKYTKTKPSKYGKMIVSKPKKEYQAYSFTKTDDEKPKIEMIQSKQSQIVPVAIQKVYREKWYIARNPDGIPIRF